MRFTLSLLAIMIAAPAFAETDDILVLGRGLPMGPGVPAYGSVLIDADRLREVGRLEGALLDVAGFQQFRRSDSRSANPSAQGRHCGRWVAMPRAGRL